MTTSKVETILTVGYLPVSGSIYGSRFGDLYGFQQTDDKVNYPDTGSVDSQKLLVGGEEIMRIGTTRLVVGRIAVIRSFISVRNQNAFDWTSFTINGKEYPVSAFSKDFHQPSEVVLSSLYLPNVDWMNGCAEGDRIEVAFTL